MKLELPKEKVFPMPFRFWVIVAVALVILMVNGWHPVLVPLAMFGFWGITASRGTVMRGEDQKMFRYYSVYGIPMGSWEDIRPNAAVVALDEQQSVRQTMLRWWRWTSNNRSVKPAMEERCDTKRARNACCIWSMGPTGKK